MNNHPRKVFASCMVCPMPDSAFRLLWFPALWYQSGIPSWIMFFQGRSCSSLSPKNHRPTPQWSRAVFVDYTNGSSASRSSKAEKLDSIALFAVLLRNGLSFGCLKFPVRTSSTETNVQHSVDQPCLPSTSYS